MRHTILKVLTFVNILLWTFLFHIFYTKFIQIGMKVSNRYISYKLVDGQYFVTPTYLQFAH